MLHVQSSRCGCCLVINGSTHPVELRGAAATLLKGRGSATLGDRGLGFDRATRRIAGGGGVVLVVFWGQQWSLLHDGHAKVVVETSAFTATVGTKRAKIDFVVSTVTAGVGSGAPERTYDSVRFLEETVSRNGTLCKYVIYIGDPRAPGGGR